MRHSSTRRTRQAGNIMVLFVLLLPAVLLPVVGLAIDAAVARLVEVKLQAAVDGAVLGAGRLLGTPAVPEVLAEEFLKANFPMGVRGSWGAYDLTHTEKYDNGVVKKIVVTAHAKVPLLFLRVLGFSEATVGATGTATRADSRVIFIFDRSGSMSGMLANVKGYAQGFVTNFIPGTDELGLIAYSTSAVVGYPTTTTTWSPTIIGSTGGPNRDYMQDGQGQNTANSISNQMGLINSGGYTNTSEALSLAYIELQKAHMRDLLADPTNKTDLRLNSIVLFTDGVPSAVTLNPNSNDANYNALKSGTGSCTNKSIDRVANPTQAMIGTLTGPGTDPTYGPKAADISGMWLVASLDPTPAHTSTFWMGTPSPLNSDNWTGLPDSTPYAGCLNFRNDYKSGTSANGYLRATGTTQLVKVPTLDYYGNRLTTNAYTHSAMVSCPKGCTQILSSTPTFTDATNATYDSAWGAAHWNATDDAGYRIRTDADRLKRGTADTEGLPVTIFTIGYVGVHGNDAMLLKRLANDKSLGADWDSTQKTGQYWEADNAAGLQNAFAAVATAILRLAQ